MNDHQHQIRMKTFLLVAFCCICVSGIQVNAAEAFLVENGQPHAEIVITDNPPRTTRLAADELQTYIEKISGATLPIATEPSADVPVKIYVGRSSHTDEMGITNKDLKYGAYQIISGDNWMVLIGDDTDFVPIEPWPCNNNDIVSGKTQRAWNDITGEHWGFPVSQLRKHYTGSAKLFGIPGEQHVDEDGHVNVWGFDERGSFNAVCGFLRSLGVRWYMPGELGEIVPELKTIVLPRINETVWPDFTVRRFNARFGTHGRDTAMWMMRLGERDPYGLQIAHGMDRMTRPPEVMKAHPEWFALYGGQHDNDPDKGNTHHLCYSNEGLYEATVRYVRAVFDHYQFNVVSVMPPDGYVSMCQCPLCEGKATPDQGDSGRFSDYVWDFVNRVAKEVGKTHPNKMVSNCAYSAYKLPPQNIDKLEQNVQVCIVGGRRPRANLREEQEEIRRLREAWITKTDNPIIIFENYPFTDRGWFLPTFTVQSIGESINATKGISLGEDIWLSFRRDFEKMNIGFNHFLVYFTARMYWGGSDVDVNAMFEEYCRKFYGPAGSEMQSFFQYCEDHWRDMDKDKIKADTALERLIAAQAAVAQGSIHAQRITLVDEFLQRLRYCAKQLGKLRGPVPKLRLLREVQPGDIVIDGKLDDEYWQNCPVSSSGSLRESQTGRAPAFATTIKSAWRSNNIYFGIRCEERRGESLNISTTKPEDPTLWQGDAVEILLETESHSYYHIAVNPAGALIDLDNGASKEASLHWDSKAEVATHLADDHWTVEIRIPVTEDDNDPLHLVVGRVPPLYNLPWFFNLCRRRIRDNGLEYSAFSPTGKESFQESMKFAHYYKGSSYKFTYAEPEPDYLQARRAAEELFREHRREEAITAFAKLARREGLTDFQRCDALTYAADYSRIIKDFERAEQFADLAPVEAVAKTLRMQIFLARRESAKLIALYGSEDIDMWPFWIAAKAFLARGRAYSTTGTTDRAEADFRAALELTSDKHLRKDILRALGYEPSN
jgi:tetratricopeptide (TPR) repeat protein